MGNLTLFGQFHRGTGAVRPLGPKSCLLHLGHISDARKTHSMHTDLPGSDFTNPPLQSWGVSVSRSRVLRVFEFSPWHPCKKLSMVGHVYNPSTGEAETRGSLGLAGLPT